MNPIVKKWEEDVNVIMGEFGAVRKIISRFDEVLLEKASKFSVDKLTHETKINYMTLEKISWVWERVWAKGNFSKEWYKFFKAYSWYRSWRIIWKTLRVIRSLCFYNQKENNG